MSPGATRGNVVLLTGVTGFVGKLVLEGLVRRSEELGVARVLALVRAGSPEHADARLRAEVVGSPCFAAHPPGWDKRVEAIAGDLTKPGLGLAPDVRARVVAEATQWIHCAASVEFDRPLAEATAVNTTGALAALELARGCRRLDSFVGVSTAYVTPHPGAGVLRVREELAPLPRDAERVYADVLAGRAREADLLAETGHPNTYTLTKCVAEHLLARRAARLRVTLLRPSIVSVSRALPQPGWIDSAAAFAGFVALLGSGRLRAVAGDPHARLDVVPCDAVAERVVEAAFAPPARGELRIRHAVAGLAGALPIALCRERITRHFERSPAGPGRVAIRFVGPRGPRFLLAHAWHHELPALGASLWTRLRGRPERANSARRLLARQRATNRDFGYFTHATFDFATGVPLDPPLDPERYLDLVCDGVGRHLLRSERRRGRAGAG